MRALTVIPGRANSAALADVPEPPPTDGPVLVKTLAKADLSWLGRVANRRVPLERWHDALVRQADDVKPIIELAT